MKIEKLKQTITRGTERLTEIAIPRAPVGAKNLIFISFIFSVSVSKFLTSQKDSGGTQKEGHWQAT